MSEIDIIDCVSLPTLKAFAKKAMEENASLRARIEKLEAALRTIRDRPDYRLPSPQAIASEALKEQG